jgi:hypothetical protein
MTRKVTLLMLAVLALGALEACGGGGAKTPTSVTVSPKLSEVAAGVQNQSFTATLAGSGSAAGVTWSVDGVANGNTTVGAISSSGVYSAPATAGTHTITATSVADSSKSDTATVAVTDLTGVFTYHNDLSRDGANTQEYLLSSTTVTQSTFGKLFSCPVDGAIYTQPLWVPGVSINGALHNVIYVATQHDSVYAFDADANPCVKLWQVSLLANGEGPVVWNDVGYCYGDIYPEVGVTGTPVIDPASSTIYLIAASEIPGAQSGNCSLPAGAYFHRLHALDITNGSEKPNSPVTIAAQVPGIGDGSSGGVVKFSSQLHHNRSGLALSGDGTVYVAFAAHEDAYPYHGWLLGYDASNVQQQVSLFNTTPNGIFGANGGADGGIWGGGGAPAIDSGNAVFVATGNGIFDQGTGMSLQNDYGDSVLSLSPPAALGGAMQVNGWFSPDDELSLEQTDADLGSGAPVLLPDQTAGPMHLLVQLGKDGVIYLINRDSMGFFNPNANQIVQTVQATGAFWGTPAFWQNNLYFAGAGDSLKQFAFDGVTPWQFNTSASSQTSQNFGFPDVSPSVSSQGSSNGVVWAIDAGLYGYASPNSGNPKPGYCYSAPNPVPAACTGPAVLHAYSATNLATEYWNSSQAPSNRDQAGNAVKFVPPTIANGKVYVGTRTEIDVYGVLP